MLFKPKHFNSMYFDASADKGTGSTGTPPEDGTPPENSGKKPITFESEEAYQADLEAKLKDRLEREHKKAEAATAKAKADAEAEAAKKNGEWQKLAEQREKELADLQKQLAEFEPVKGKATRYEETLKKYLDTQKKDLPAHILALLEKLDTVGQLEYITANAEVLHKPDSVKTPGSPQQLPNRGGNKPKVDEKDLYKPKINY